MRRSRSAVVAALWLASWLAAPVATAEDAASDLVVAGIEWQGNEAIDSERLEEAILSQAPDWRVWRPRPPFDESTLRGDLDRIADLYAEHGYYEAKATYTLETSRFGRAVRIEMVVDEGEPVRLESWNVRLEEDPPRDLAPDDPLLAGLPLSPGEQFSARGYREAGDALLARMAARGHPDARLEGGAEVELDENSARIDWTLHPGPSVRFDGVEITGLDTVEEAIVRRELTFAPGERFTPAKLAETQRRLAALELFRGVTLEPLRPSREPEALPPASVVEDWKVAVRLVERDMRSLRVSAGYGTEDEFRGQISWRHRNLFGGARRLDISGKYSSLVQGGDIDFLQPHVLDTQLDLRLSTAAGWKDEPAYRAFRVRNRVGLRRAFARRWTARGGYGVDFNEIVDTDVNDLQILGQGDRRRIAYAFLGVRRDGRDDVLEPTRGTWFDLEVAPAWRGIGSQLDFVRIGAEGRGYVPIGPTVLALRARAGTIEAIGRTDSSEIPIYERYFLGGSTSVRGFRYHRVPPLDIEGRPFGGLSAIEGTVELRFPLFWRLGGVAFADAGDVESRSLRWDLTDLSYTAGGGLRLSTPVGPIRVDVGYLLNRPRGADRFRVYFSIGHVF